jgi:hypothetical protein
MNIEDQFEPLESLGADALDIIASAKDRGVTRAQLINFIRSQLREAVLSAIEFSNAGSVLGDKRCTDLVTGFRALMEDLNERYQLGVKPCDS